MLYNFKELLEIYGNRYKVNKAIEEKKILKIERGIYSDDEYPNGLDVVTKKYPKAVFTMNSAYYFYDLTDVIPRKDYLAIELHQKVAKDDRIKFYYMTKRLHELGVTTLNTHNTTINIYDKEKLLIELVRNKNSLGYDYYKEIINNYREIAYDLDIPKMEEYLEYYKNKNRLLTIIKDEVY